jgi:hypothetical protein
MTLTPTDARNILRLQPEDDSDETISLLGTADQETPSEGIEN